MNGNKNMTQTEQTLESLNGLQRAAAPPFLYTRIRARLERDAETPLSWRDRLAALLAKPAVAFGCIAVIAALNMAVVFSRSGAENGSVTSDLVADAYNADVAAGDDAYSYAEQ
jgi:hypothetical protein